MTVQVWATVESANGKVWLYDEPKVASATPGSVDADLHPVLAAGGLVAGQETESFSQVALTELCARTRRCW